MIIKNLIKIWHFLIHGIWNMNLVKENSHKKRFFYKQLRIIILSFRGFFQDNCIMRAGSLTFYSFLSIVPILALAFAVTKGFGIENLLQKLLEENLSEHPEAVAKVINYAQSALTQSKSSVIAGIGVLFLFYTVIKVFGHIERSFNYIWNIHRHRSIIRKISDYLSFLIICPTLLVLYASATVYLKTYITSFSSENNFIASISSPVLLLIVKLTPFLSLWLLFCFIYLFIPNTKVKLSSALIGGFVATILFVGLQNSYILLQTTVTRYNAIYGSFSALPLFLMWLEISWYIVLFGAEITFANQNVDTYEFEPQCQELSSNSRLIISLEIFRTILQRYTAKQPALNDKDLASECNLPIRLTREIIYNLTIAKLVTEVTDSTSTKIRGAISYVPAYDFHEMRLSEFINQLNNDGEKISKLGTYNHNLSLIEKSYQSYHDSVVNLKENVKVVDLVKRSL